MKQRLEFEREREQSMHLNTLLQKQFLTPEEENIKRHLIVLRVAKVSMKRDEIVENLRAAIDGVVEFIPKK
ncbi:hypothetical protein R6Q59_032003 [Mikania micrantha]